MIGSRRAQLAVGTCAVLAIVAGLALWNLVTESDPTEAMGTITVDLASGETVPPSTVVVAVPAADEVTADVDPTTDAERVTVDASGYEGSLVLDREDTIYDFGNVEADRDITIAASNVEARNIRGPGARRIGRRDGNDYVNSGFRDFDFTYMATENGGGGRLVDPYFVDGTDLNPDGLEAEGSPAHIYAYQGDVVRPLLEGVTVRGWKVPEDSEAHNDAIHFTGIEGGRVIDPTIRDSSVVSGSAIGVLARHTYGTFTIEGSTFEARWTSYHAVLGNSEDVDQPVTLLWRDNTLVRASTASFLHGYVLDPESEVGDDAVVVQS